MAPDTADWLSGFAVNGGAAGFSEAPASYMPYSLEAIGDDLGGEVSAYFFFSK